MKLLIETGHEGPTCEGCSHDRDESCPWGWRYNDDDGGEFRRWCRVAERAAAELMAKAEAFDRILAVHRDDRLIDEGFSEGVLTVIEDYYGSLAHPEVK